MIGALLLVIVSTTPEEDFAQAVAAYKNGLHGPALYAMEQLLLEPDFSAIDSALLIAGQSAFTLGRYEKGLRYLDRHLSDASSPDPGALESAVFSALELNKPLEAFRLFSDFPRFPLSQDVKLQLAEALSELEKYRQSRDVYTAIDDPDIRLIGAKMLLGARRDDLLRPYLADLEQTWPGLAEDIRRLQLEQSISRGDSLLSVEAGLGMGDPSDLSSTEAYTLGRLFQKFNLYEDAVVFYASAVDNHYYDALLPLASCYSALGENKKAVRTYEEAHKKLSFSSQDRALEARVRLLTGEDFDAKSLADVQFRTFDEYSKALELLDDEGLSSLYERFLLASSFQRTEDILRKARMLSAQGRFKAALETYNEYLFKAPFAESRAQAAKEALLIEYFEIKDAETALQKLVNATTSSDKGKILFEDAKDYQGTIKFLDTVSTPQAFYYSALSFERLYERDGKIKLLDKARERYENLYWQYPEDRLVEDALYRLFIIEIRDPLKRVDRALDYLDHYPEGKYSDEIRFRLGYVHLARQDTMAAQNDWETLYLTRPNSPFNFPVLYGLAQISLASGDTADAVAKFSLLLSVAPQDTLYFYALDQLTRIDLSREKNIQALSRFEIMAKELGYLQIDMWEEAIEIIFTLQSYRKFDLFYSLVEDKQYREEIDFYRDVAKVKDGKMGDDDVRHILHNRPAGKKDEYLYWSGIACQIVDYNRLAEHLLERVTVEGRDSIVVADAKKVLSQIRIGMENYEWAAATLDSLYLQNPKDTLVLRQLVIALYRSGEVKRADSLWRKLDYMTVSDQSPLLLEKVAYLIGVEQVLAADTVLTQLQYVRQLWKNEEFLYYKGLVAARLKRSDEAVEIFRQYVNQFPEAPKAGAVHFMLGTLYHMQQELDSAIVHFEHSLTSPERRIYALENLAKIARSREKWARSFEYYELLVEETSDQKKRGLLYVDMGYTAFVAEKLTRALNYFDKAVPLVAEEERPRLLYWTAATHSRFAEPEHLEQAISIFLQCHEEYPGDQYGLQSWLEAGNGYVYLERYEDARVIFQAVLNQRGPDDPFGVQAQRALQDLP